MSLFITCPVADVDRAAAFYAALGWPKQEQFSREGAARFAVAPGASGEASAFVMLGSRAMYESVGATEELVGTPETPSKVTVSFDVGTREALGELLERAAAAGGRIGDTDDYGFMVQRQFDDLDGYHYSPFWMNPEAAAE